MSSSGILRPVRLPSVLTALADPVAGLLVIRAAGVPIRDVDCALIAAAGCLYAAGIALGVGLRGALMLAGVALAFAVSMCAGVVAIALVAAIVACQVGLERSPVGPLAIGSRRALSLGLGMTPALAAGHGACSIALAVPIALGSYVAALSYIARRDVDVDSERRTRAGLSAMALIAVTCNSLLVFHPAVPRSIFAWPWVAIVMFIAVQNWLPLWWPHDDRAARRAIGGGMVLIPLLDGAACAAAGEPFWALAVAALAVPALLAHTSMTPGGGASSSPSSSEE